VTRFKDKVIMANFTQHSEEWVKHVEWERQGGGMGSSPPPPAHQMNVSSLISEIM